MLAVLAYIAARVGAVAKLTMKNLVSDGTQYTLRFAEKGGESREIPVRHDLEQFPLAYIQSANISEGPLFRTANRKTLLEILLNGSRSECERSHLRLSRPCPATGGPAVMARW